ncbi:MAG TPA: pyridoxamine 5'-phosphate oxidase family protein [Blastocatellia bacterium]|nr:pyridoxamine 5'-phosphate oxidase family protein [Blastocatellia bacterium]
MLKHMDPDEAKEVIRRGRIGRLGCVIESGPYIVPIGYYLEDDSIYSHSLMGQKIYALRADPRACLQVDEVIDDYHWRSAIAFGRYEEITQEADRARVLRGLMERFPHFTPVESVPVHNGQSSVIVFRVRIKEVSGVSEG